MIALPNYGRQPKTAIVISKRYDQAQKLIRKLNPSENYDYAVLIIHISSRKN